MYFRSAAALQYSLRKTILDYKVFVVKAKKKVLVKWNVSLYWKKKKKTKTTNPAEFLFPLTTICLQIVMWTSHFRQNELFHKNRTSSQQNNLELWNSTNNVKGEQLRHSF